MVFVFKTCYGGQVLNVHNPVDTFIVQYVALQLRHYNHEMTNGLGNLEHQLKRVEMHNNAQLYCNYNIISITFTLVTESRSKSATRCLTVSLKGRCVYREK